MDDKLICNLSDNGQTYPFCGFKLKEKFDNENLIKLPKVFREKTLGTNIIFILMSPPSRGKRNVYLTLRLDK